MEAEQLSREALEEYLSTRSEITKHVDRVSAVAHLLGLLRRCGDDSIPISPMALAVIGDLVDSDICGIQESLDGFLFPSDAESALQK